MQRQYLNIAKDPGEEVLIPEDIVEEVKVDEAGYQVSTSIGTVYKGDSLRVVTMEEWIRELKEECDL